MHLGGHVNCKLTLRVLRCLKFILVKYYAL